MFEALEDRLNHAYDKHGCEPWSRHEFFGILKEEVDELWEDIKCDCDQRFVLDELLDIVCVCFRYFETPDRYNGWNPSMSDVLRFKDEQGLGRWAVAKLKGVESCQSQMSTNDSE